MWIHVEHISFDDFSFCNNIYNLEYRSNIKSIRKLKSILWRFNINSSRKKSLKILLFYNNSFFNRCRHFLSYFSARFFILIWLAVFGFKFAIKYKGSYLYNSFSAYDDNQRFFRIEIYKFIWKFNTCICYFSFDM